MAFLYSDKAYAQTDSVNVLKEVNVKSTTIPQLQTATPSQVISASQFLQYNAFNVADAIRNFAGVNVRDKQYRYAVWAQTILLCCMTAYR
ncbi:MAG: hypothetical protein EOP46_14475 [Sphingobacteriaceae bacterium]|nr:MAG: hypothetical protein EOP46_14475 [Sphingobacteriaceae bacterium]